MNPPEMTLQELCAECRWREDCPWYATAKAYRCEDEDAEAADWRDYQDTQRAASRGVL